MPRSLAALREDWARKKAHYEELLHEWFPPQEPGAEPPPLRNVPPEVMAELERREKEVEEARLAYVAELLAGPRA